MITKRRLTNLIKKCKEINPGEMGANLIIATVTRSGVDLTVNYWNGKVFSSGKSNTRTEHVFAENEEAAEKIIQQITEKHGAVKGECIVIWDDLY